MLCQIRLPRLCDSLRASGNGHVMTHRLARRSLASASQDASLSPKQTADPRAADRERADSRALQRLKKAIDPNDLTATLEAHRESNRASVIRRVATNDHDPEITRPSFLKNVPIRRPRERSEEAKEAPVRIKHLDLPGDGPYKSSEQLMRLAREDSIIKKRLAAKGKGHKQPSEKNPVPDGDRHGARKKFLLEHEEPPVHVPAYDRTDYNTLYHTIRRCYRIIRRQQNTQKTAGRVALADLDLLEYRAKPRPLKRAQYNHPQPEPWSNLSRNKDQIPQERLERELRAFAEWIRPVPAEEAARAKVADLVLDLVRQAKPELETELFGSQITGLAMPDSDIDVRVDNFHLSPLELDPDMAASEHVHRKSEATAHRIDQVTVQLRDIQSALATHPDFDNVVINAAYYPLVAATHKPSGINIQIVANQDTSASNDAVKRYLAEIPNLNIIYPVMKMMLGMHNLTDPWNGGFGSYTLFMMCVAALKIRDCEVVLGTKSAAKHETHLATDFLQILHFWGRLDTYLYGVSIEPPATWYKRSFNTPEEKKARESDPSLYARFRIRVPDAYRPYLLCLQDPANPYNDLGRSSIAIKDLQATFINLFNRLKSDFKDQSKAESNRPLLRRVVGRCDLEYDKIRTQIELFGSEFMEEGDGQDTTQAGAEAKAVVEQDSMAQSQQT